MKRKSFWIVLLLLLPAAAGWVLAHHNAFAHSSTPPPHIEAQSAGIVLKITDCELFSVAKGRLHRVSSANAVYYLSGFHSGSWPVSAFTTPAPLVYDGSVGDISTGYADTTNAVDGYLNVLYDLGVSPPSVSRWSVTTNPSNFGASLNIYYSSNGTSWTQADAQTVVTAGHIYILGSPITARYWRFQFYNGISGGGTFNATDARLYDGSAVLINGPATAPTVTLTPSQTFDRLLNPIDAVAWTSTDATSVSIAASAGASPGSVTPVAGGSVGVSPPAAGATYTATATGPGGSAVASTSFPGNPSSINPVQMSVNGTPGIAVQGT